MRPRLNRKGPSDWQFLVDQLPPVRGMGGGPDSILRLPVPPATRLPMWKGGRSPRAAPRDTAARPGGAGTLNAPRTRIWREVRVPHAGGEGVLKLSCGSSGVWWAWVRPKKWHPATPPGEKTLQCHLQNRRMSVLCLSSPPSRPHPFLICLEEASLQ